VHKTISFSEHKTPFLAFGNIFTLMRSFHRFWHYWANLLYEHINESKIRVENFTFLEHNGPVNKYSG